MKLSLAWRNVIPSRYKLTRLARRDLAAIEEYTVAQWGVDQALSYFLALKGRMDFIAAMPESGRRRDDMCPGYRSTTAREHMIFYRQLNADTIEIVRVLHQHMDFSRHL